MLDREYLKRISEAIGGGFWILSSSIHEVIILPGEFDPEAKHNLDQMVQEVNRTQLKPEEYLADHAYHFNRQSGMIEMEPCAA